MNWKHYDGTHRTTVSALHDDQILEADIEIGRILTGKSRQHSGYYCKTTRGDRVEITEAGSIYQAVHAAACRLNDMGVTIDIYAMRSDFYESGHSADTGWGYVNGIQKPVLMIDAVGVVRESPNTSETRILRQMRQHR